MMCIVALVVLLFTLSEEAALASPRFSRGVGIFKMMSWARVEPAPSKQFIRPAFSESDRVVSDTEIASLKDVGFDFVRLTVDPGPFLQFNGSDRDNLDAILLRNVRRFLKFGLKVIVDFHPGIQHEDYVPDKLVRGLDDPLFLRYVEMVRHTAKLLAREEFINAVALELMNEPSLGIDVRSARLWERLQRTLYRAARDESHDLTLIVTGGQFGNYTGLVRLNPAGLKDDNTLFTFHYYLPTVFTHQGVSNDLSCICFFRVPYPPERDQFDRLWPAIEDRIGKLTSSGASASLPVPAARKLLTKYLQRSFDERNIGQNFDEVLSWANANSIDPTKILLGEFGVSRSYDENLGARDEDVWRWLNDIRRAAETRKFSWAVWEYKGHGGMSIMTDDHSSEVYPVIVDALGLNAPHARP